MDLPCWRSIFCSVITISSKRSFLLLGFIRLEEKVGSLFLNLHVSVL